jgi:uncharacterized protein YbaR (Trm112 family)
MKYKASVLCPTCNRKYVLTEEQTILAINEGLSCAKDIEDKHLYPGFFCRKCETTFLIDENIKFEKQ